MTLTQIANKHKTDKGTVAYEAHGYTDVYDQFIPSDGEYKLLEIGVWHGDSIRMWQEFNPELEIHAIDINTDVFNYIKNSDKTFIHIGNQSDEDFLKTFSKYAPFDFIIDDGSHVFSDIISSVDGLLPYLKKGGIYFIEDLHAAYANRKNVIEYVENLGFNPTLWKNKLLYFVK